MAAELLVTLDRGRGRLTDQLTAALREAVGSGRLPVGTRLPSTRDLADQLRVSRGLVVTAYEQLAAEGLLVARTGAGTVVGPLARRPPLPEPTADPGTTTAPAGGEPTQPGTGRAAPLRPGVPDLGAFPRTAWRRAYERALRTLPDADLGYGDPAGLPGLRRELATYLARVRAARVSPDRLLVTTGAAQAFALLAQLLRATGRTRVGVEDPGSPVIRGHLAAAGLTPVPVPVDRAGLRVTDLHRTGVAAVLVTPAHQFPTGVALSPARRAELVGWARAGDRLVIEDDYDAEFRYDRDPVGCLQGLAPEVVALVGSVSKALAPGLRMGWLAAPPRSAARVAAFKDTADHGGPVIEQAAFADLLATGGYDRQLRSARRTYRRRRDAVLAGLRRYLPRARVTGVAAGLHLVVELPTGVDDVALAARARTVGLDPWPLSPLRVATAGPAGLVLGYGGHTPDELTGAVSRLSGLV